MKDCLDIFLKLMLALVLLFLILFGGVLTIVIMFSFNIFFFIGESFIFISEKIRRILK